MALYQWALVAAKRYTHARKKLAALIHCIKISNSGTIEFGFNERIKAQGSKPMREEWQTWSAALYLYAAKCVEEKCTPFF